MICANLIQLINNVFAKHLLKHIIGDVFFLIKISFISIKKSTRGVKKCRIKEYYIQKKWSGQGPGVMIFP